MAQNNDAVGKRAKLKLADSRVSINIKVVSKVRKRHAVNWLLPEKARVNKNCLDMYEFEISQIINHSIYRLLRDKRN